MADDNSEILRDWAAKVLDALEVTDFNPNIDEVLNLAGDAARTVVRPAAPLTTFLAGYAAGLATANGQDANQAASDAIAIASALCSD